ncbi:MAG: PfkB family carbohydrate kinase [Ignisphaera sp.]
MKTLIVGNITIDEVGDRIRVGGTGYYGGRALAEYLDAEVYVATNIGEAYKGLVKSVLESHGIKVIEIGYSSTPVFVIRDGKAVSFKGESPRISLSNLEPYARIYRFDVVILGPIFREIDLNEIDQILSWGSKVVALDIQGLVRSVADGELKLVWDYSIEEKLRKIDIVHGNVKEFCFSDDIKNVLGKAREWSSTTKTIYLISLDERGLYIVANNEILYVRPPPTNPVDEVGAGDILLSVTAYYIAKGFNTIESVLRGVAAATLKIENAYREWFDRNSLESLAKELERFVEGVNI